VVKNGAVITNWVAAKSLRVMDVVFANVGAMKVATGAFMTRVRSYGVTNSTVASAGADAMLMLVV